ncbi:hypothetical protein SISNIDRAFT_278886 [Sistotremastrum niveocremeum HHB9708]|uniref:Uncharacterized protein n=1 Tax=Sistotremastrum niveocremeum HHB9708 TaxID=1314777 RepID=A0A164NQ37_9AGAM|nr:hypothetical protein SISNIDRAFT_278886 [Sistotremastrum niveocremeum HHB9708]
MRSLQLYILSGALVLFRTCVALPASDSTYPFSKRSTLCGLNVRTAVAQDCIDNRPPLSFILSGSQTRPTVIRQNSPDGDDIPPGSSCDHAVELQVLEAAIQGSGMCELVAAMNRIRVAPTKQLQGMADVISGPANLLFLASSISNAKESFIINSMASRTITSANVANIAVNAYLQDPLVTSGSLMIARQLDVLLEDLLTDAVQRASLIFTPPPGQRPLSRDEINRQEFKEAVDHVVSLQDRLTVTTLWNKVVHAAVVPC